MKLASEHFAISCTCMCRLSEQPNYVSPDASISGTTSDLVV